jgi:hypothetical protein
MSVVGASEGVAGELVRLELANDEATLRTGSS